MIKSERSWRNIDWFIAVLLLLTSVLLGVYLATLTKQIQVKKEITVIQFSSKDSMQTATVVLFQDETPILFLNRDKNTIIMNGVFLK